MENPPDQTRGRRGRRTTYPFMLEPTLHFCREFDFLRSVFLGFVFRGSVLLESVFLEPVRERYPEVYLVPVHPSDSPFLAQQMFDKTIH